MGKQQRLFSKPQEITDSLGDRYMDAAVRDDRARARNGRVRARATYMPALE